MSDLSKLNKTVHAWLFTAEPYGFDGTAAP